MKLESLSFRSFFQAENPLSLSTETRARTHARSPDQQREHGAVGAGHQRGEAGQHQQQRYRRREPEAHSR